MIPNIFGPFAWVINILLLLLSWGVAGYIAGRIMRGKSYGLIGNVLMGLMGGIVGSLLVWALGLSSIFSFPFASIVVGVIGAVVLVFVANILNSASNSKS